MWKRGKHHASRSWWVVIVLLLLACMPFFLLFDKTTFFESPKRDGLRNEDEKSQQMDDGLKMKSIKQRDARNPMDDQSKDDDGVKRDESNDEINDPVVTPLKDRPLQFIYTVGCGGSSDAEWQALQSQALDQSFIDVG